MANDLAVTNAATEGIGWDTPPTTGIHRGICQVMGFGSYIA